MGKHTSSLSRLIQLTAIIYFAYAFYRLYIYFTNWLEPPEYMIYAIFAAIVVGIGILMFDEVYKPSADYVRWAFLTGVGLLSLVLGLFFTFFPEFRTNFPLSGIWPRALIFILLGLIVIIESLLVRRDVIPGTTGVNSDTVGPIILKFVAMFGLAWGIYQMAWVLVPVFRGVVLTSILPLFFSALGFVLSGLSLVIYFENNKRKPQFRARRFPLLMSLILTLMILPLLTTYLYIYLVLALPNALELLVNAIIGLATTVALLISSF
ncbi:MAG: hypothetical protein Q6361_00095, partial [Candidatus Hermodarchaeota archaeon]|nr:hypothetical protein [Candidatus Hermodarchaeota archaeon]